MFHTVIIISCESSFKNQVYFRICAVLHTGALAIRWALCKGEKKSKQSNRNEHHSTYTSHQSPGNSSLCLTHSKVRKFLRLLNILFIANSNTSFPFFWPWYFSSTAAHLCFPLLYFFWVPLCYDLIPLFIHIGISCINYGPLIVP